MERKAKELVERLKRNGITRFLLLFRGDRSRSELVAIHGGAGAVPEPYHPVGGFCRRLHGDLSGDGGGMSVETREMKEIEAAVEGILFASGAYRPHLSGGGLDRPTAELVLQKLMDYYSFERRGMRLLRLEDSWRLCPLLSMPTLSVGPLNTPSPPSCPSRRWRC